MESTGQNTRDIKVPRLRPSGPNQGGSRTQGDRIVRVVPGDGVGISLRSEDIDFLRPLHGMGGNRRTGQMG